LLEATELYKKKSGSEIVEQLFNFTDKAEREVALRPELTPTLARVVAAHEREFKKPLKWFSIGEVFRYEKQQRGRLREHFQLNCDIVGESDLAADIELVALCIDVLRAFGLTENDFVVRISDREFWTDFLRERDVPADRWDEFLQTIDKFGREPREKTAQKLGNLADPVFATLKSAGKSEKLGKLVDALHGGGLADFVAIDIGIVRGLAYYTGIVFEVFDRAGKFRAIAGGGRYDKLIEQLRDLGYSVDYPLTPTRVPKQFQTAEDLGATTAILYGDEWPQVKIKNMATAQQELVPHDRLLAHLQALPSLSS